MAIAVLSFSSACAGRLPGDVDDGIIEPPPPPPPPVELPCADSDAPLDRFQMCIGARDEIDYQTIEGGLAFTVDGVVSPFTDDDLRMNFSTCTIGMRPPSNEITYIETADNRYMLELIATREDGSEALPFSAVPFELGTPVQFEMRIGGWAGHALHLTTPDVHVAMVELGTMESPQDDVVVARGEPNGPPEENDCGVVQEDFFDVTYGEDTAQVANGECANVGDAAFLGVMAFRVLSTQCTDHFSGFTWGAVWPAR